MIITLGIYDVFAYTIPGLLYLYAIYEFLRRIGVDFSEIFAILSSAGVLVGVALLIVTAYMVGHLLDTFAHFFVYRIFKRRKTSEFSLQSVKNRYSGLAIHFQARDWSLLFTLLRQRNVDHARTLDSFEANSVMLRNICFGLFLLLLLQIHTLLVNYNNAALIIAIGIALMSFLAGGRSYMFHLWFFAGIFEGSLDYGNSLEEVKSYRKNKELSQLSSETSKRKTQRK